MKCSAPQALRADGQRRRDTCEPEHRNWPADIFKCRTLRLPDQEKAARPQTRRLSSVLYDWLCASLRLIKRSMLPCPLRLEGGMEGRLRVRAPRFSRKTQARASIGKPGRASSGDCGQMSRSTAETGEAARDEARRALPKGPFTAPKGRLPSRQRMLPLKSGRCDLRLLHQPGTLTQPYV